MEEVEAKNEHCGPIFLIIMNCQQICASVLRFDIFQRIISISNHYLSKCEGKCSMMTKDRKSSVTDQKNRRNSW